MDKLYYSYVQNDLIDESYLCSDQVITDKAEETSDML